MCVLFPVRGVTVLAGEAQAALRTYKRLLVHVKFLVRGVRRLLGEAFPAFRALKGLYVRMN